MGISLFIIYTFITFLVLFSGALFWYFSNINISCNDLSDKAFAFFKKGDYEKAKELFLLALIENPEFKTARYNLGVTFLATKEYRNAVICFEEVLKNFPDDFDSQYNLGLVYFKIGDYQTAREIFEKILESEPQEFCVIFNLALTLQMQKFYDEANELYEKAIEINPDDADCYFNQGIILFENRNYEKALELFEKAKDLAIERIDIAFAILRCKEELCPFDIQEENKVILNQYKKLSKASDLPLEFDVFYSRAYAKSGNIEKAVEICNRAIISTPENAMTYRVMGLIKLFENKLEDAKQNLFKAISLNAKEPESYNILSYVFLQQNNQEEYYTYKKIYKDFIAKKTENTVNAR